MQKSPPFRVKPAIGAPLNTVSYVIPSFDPGAADAGSEKTEIDALPFVKKSGAAAFAPTLRPPPPRYVEPSFHGSATKPGRPIWAPSAGTAASVAALSPAVPPVARAVCVSIIAL